MGTFFSWNISKTEEQISRLRKNRVSIYDIKDLTTEAMKYYIKELYGDIGIINDPPEEIQLISVRMSPRTIRNIQNPTKEVQMFVARYGYLHPKQYDDEVRMVAIERYPGTKFDFDVPVDHLYERHIISKPGEYTKYFFTTKGSYHALRELWYIAKIHKYKKKYYRNYIKWLIKYPFLVDRIQNIPYSLRQITFPETGINTLFDFDIGLSYL